MNFNELKFGTEEENIKHVTVLADRVVKQGKQETVLKKVYVEMNDGSVQVIKPGLKNQSKFRKELAEYLRAWGASTTKNQDYEVAEYKDEMIEEFDRLQSVYKNGKPVEEEYSFDIPEDAHISNLTLNSEILEDEVIEIKEDEIPEALDAEIEEEEVTEGKKKLTKGEKILLAVGVVALGTAIGATAAAYIKNQEQAKAATPDTTAEETVEYSDMPEEETIEYAEKISIDGQDFAFYKENVPANDQKYAFVDIDDYVLDFNRSEDWMYEVIDEEMASRLEEMGITVEDNEAIFGFTAEDLFYGGLVWGNYTDEQVLTQMNGENINVSEVWESSESMANQLIRKHIIYLLNGDNPQMTLPFMNTWSEQDMSDYLRFTGMYGEWKSLTAEGKYDEAEQKMKEIKHEISEYAHQQDVDKNNAKPYIVRTVVPACSIVSNVYGYTDTITLNLYNGTTGNYEDKDVKTWLWDEITMRNLVEGYNPCLGPNGEVLQEGLETIEFLKQFNINTSIYTLVLPDDGVSIADEFTGGITSKLESYNEFITATRQDNLMADSAYVGVGGDANDPYLQHNNRFDELTENSYDADQLCEMINNDLKNVNKYPKFIDFFTSIESKFGKLMMEVKDAMYKVKFAANEAVEKLGKVVTTITAPVTRYIPGQTYTTTSTRTWTETYRSTRSEKHTVSEAEKDAEAKAKAQPAKTFTVHDNVTGKDVKITDQDLYNKILKGEDSDRYTTKNSNANKIKKIAEEDNKDYDAKKKQEEEDAAKAKETYKDKDGNTHYIIGGDVTTTEDYKEAKDENGKVTVTDKTGKELDTATESEAEEYNRKLREQQAAEEAKKAEEAQRAQEEANRKAQEDAQRAQEEANRRAQEEAQRAQEEAQRQQELEAARQEAERIANETPKAEEGYTPDDPTQSPTFAPAVDDSVDATFSAAYEDEIDNLIADMASAVDSETIGMSK